MRWRQQARRHCCCTLSDDPRRRQVLQTKQPAASAEVGDCAILRRVDIPSRECCVCLTRWLPDDFEAILAGVDFYHPAQPRIPTQFRSRPNPTRFSACTFVASGHADWPQPTFSPRRRFQLTDPTDFVVQMNYRVLRGATITRGDQFLAVFASIILMCYLEVCEALQP
jgi:hypothetical protein